MNTDHFGVFTQPATVARLLVFMATLPLASCREDSQPSPKADSRTNGLIVTPAGADAETFVPWVSEDTVNEVIRGLKRSDGGEVRFAPGVYTIRYGVVIRTVDNITITGSPDVRLEFPDSKEEPARILEAVSEGQQSFSVDRPDALRKGGLYQLHSADTGIRILEFRARDIDGQTVHLDRKVSFMSHVKEIPAGSIAVEQLNFFRISGANNVTLRDLDMNGKGIGDVVGHTLFSGVLATNHYVPNKTPKSAVRGLKITGCTFRNLSGRGVAAYSVADLFCKDNKFSEIRAEAMEVDHYSGGKILDNEFDRCHVAIVVDDAFDTLIQGNRIKRSGCGIQFVAHFDDDWVNRGVVVTKNRIEGPGNVGVKLHRFPERNKVFDNEITGMNTPIMK